MTEDKIAKFNAYSKNVENFGKIMAAYDLNSVLGASNQNSHETLPDLNFLIGENSLFANNTPGSRLGSFNSDFVNFSEKCGTASANSVNGLEIDANNSSEDDAGQKVLVKVNLFKKNC